MVQPEGAVTAVQLRLVVELVVPEAANPVGVPGTVVQVFADVVTLIAELAADEPAASVASTAKLYAVEGVRPVTVSEVVVGVAMEVPPCSTL